MEKINLDEGYFFGLGVFETIAVKNGIPIFLEEHLERLENGLEELGLAHEIDKERIDKKNIHKYIRKSFVSDGALKISVSKDNIVMSMRDNPYTKELLEKGYHIDITHVRRNETSPLTYIKSLNYGDNIIAKRKAVAKGIDEPIFLNSKGELTEGAVSNVFLIKDKEIYTPPVTCGLLEGIVRKYIMENFSVMEKIIYQDEIHTFDEVFLTNSLMGIMPVRKFAAHSFEKKDRTMKIMDKYNKALDKICM